jgi:DNA-binding beta-propeller fold protein YncE
MKPVIARTTLVLAFALSACGGPGAAPDAPNSAGVLPQQRAAAHDRPDRGRSWMRDGAKGTSLLYVSDTETGDVYVFDYPKGKVAGAITGLEDPAGECVDANGNVFVTNTGGSNVLEYAHGGTSPIATLKDNGYFPVGCSVDPKTGNLAVTNFSSSSSGAGNIVVYKHAKGRPAKTYSDPNTPELLLCGYDDKGNLFADGLTSASGFSLLELPSGKSALLPITLDKNIASAGAVQRDGKYLAIGDQSTNVVDRFAIDSGKGTFKSTTTLKNAIAVFQFWIEGKNIVGPDSGNAVVDIWKYPAGGRATKSIRGVYVPLGAVVSNS